MKWSRFWQSSCALSLLHLAVSADLLFLLIHESSKSSIFPNEWKKRILSANPWCHRNKLSWDGSKSISKVWSIESSFLLVTMEFIWNALRRRDVLEELIIIITSTDVTSCSFTMTDWKLIRIKRSHLVWLVVSSISFMSKTSMASNSFYI